MDPSFVKFVEYRGEFDLKIALSTSWIISEYGLEQQQNNISHEWTGIGRLELKKAKPQEKSYEL